MEDQIQLIPMDLIDRPVKISRETIDPERVRELAESIREHGLRQAIELRRSNGRYEIVFGDRRYLAHKLLGKNEIKAIVRDMSDQETVIIRGIENLQRENLTPSEEGRVYLALKEEGNMSINEMARKTGKAQATIRRYLNLIQHPDNVRSAVDRKIISLLTLETLQEIDDPEAFKYHFEMAAANGITEKVARLWVDDYFKTKAGEFYADSNNPPQGNLDLELKPSYITCEVCQGPCEIKKVRNICVCPECGKKVKGSQIVKS